MSDCAEFYRERDRRTETFLNADLSPLAKPVVIRVAPRAAETLSGQVTALALMDMAARVHRTILVDAPNVTLIAPALSGAESTLLSDALLETADRIDPCGIHRTATTIPAGSPTVGIGSVGDGWQLGAHGATGALDRTPQTMDDDPITALGAAAAACLGSAALLHLAYGRSPRPAAVSVWDLRDVESRPFRTGPASAGPVALGRVAIIGAGAVSAGLAYWLHHLGVAGNWEVIDADLAQLHNTNRNLGLLPDHTGWDGGRQLAKATVTAKLIGAEPTVRWYDEWEPSMRPDLVIPLANERDVRHLVGARGEPVLLHATTGRDWEAQLHRHVAHRDQCIVCRFGHLAHAEFACSTATYPVRTDGATSTDAALPFLSAAAGLLLATTLLRLSETGELPGKENWWGWRFLGGRRNMRQSKTQCREGCRQQLELALIRKVGTGRFNHLLPLLTA